MTQAQNQVQEQQAQPQIKIGFEANLELLNPEWRTAFSTEQINQFRFFYQSAMRDLSMFIGAVKQTNDNMVQAFQFMDQNAAQTTNAPATEATPAVEPEVKPAAKAKTAKSKAKKR